jgi:fucose 4-O-acetylase-like acetyltransferase
LDELKRLEELEDSNRRLLERASALQGTIDRVEALAAVWKNRAFLVIAIFFSAIALLSCYPIALRYAQNVFNPTKIPGDYPQVSGFITKTGSDTRVAWVPFYKSENRYSWANGKRISPFNIYSYNPNLNNIANVLDQNSYFYWFDNVLSKNPYAPVKLMNEKIILENDLTAKLLIPCAAKYMIYDTTRTGTAGRYRFDADRSLILVFHTKQLQVYRPNYIGGFIRAAGRTVKADSFFDNLSIAQEYPAEASGSLAFIYEDGKLNERYGLVDIDRYKLPGNPDPGFEQWDMNQGYLYWKPESGDIQLSGDNTSRVEGKVSIKVVNKSSTSYALGWVNGTAIPTTQGEILSVESNVRYRNTKWTSVAVDGYDSRSRSWTRLAMCPTILSGTSDWHKYVCSFYVPKGITSVRPVLAAGWAADANQGPGISWFDNVRISRINNTLLSDLSGAADAATITYQKISAEKYKVHVQGAKSPFVMVFGEAFDPLWKATYSNGQSVEPIKLYGLINGFPIDRTGNYDLTISYPPQTWFLQGLVISLLTLAVCVGFLVYLWWRKRKARPRRLPATASVDGDSPGKRHEAGKGGPRRALAMPVRAAVQLQAGLSPSGSLVDRAVDIFRMPRVGNPPSRDLGVDALRGLAILLVVLGHSISNAENLTNVSTHNLKFITSNFLYTFHMPLFMLIGGYVLFSKRIRVQDRAWRLLLPFLAWIPVNWVVNRYIYHWPVSFWAALKGTILHPEVGLWFLPTLFLCSMLLIPVTFLEKKWSWMEEASLIVLFVAVNLIPVNILGIMQVKYFFAYFAIGYLAAKYRPELERKQLSDKRINVTLAGLSALFLVLFTVLYTIGRIKPYTFPMSLTNVVDTPVAWFLRYFMGALGIVLAIAVIRALRTMFAWFGLVSMEIYVAHGLMLRISFGHGWTEVLVSLFTGTFLSLALAFLVLRQWWVSAALFLGIRPRARQVAVKQEALEIEAWS